MEHALVDQVLPRMIAQRGEMVVHGAAARIDGRLALFLGDSGQGKSTLAAALHRAGHAVLSDDCVLLRPGNKGVALLPTYPSLRLLPDSLQHLYPVEEPTASMADYSSKRRLALPFTNTDGAALAALFLLESLGRASGPCEVVPISPATVCLQLTRQSFLVDPSDLSNAGSALARNAGIADSLPAFALRYSRNFAQLPEVVHAIASRLAQLPVVEA